MQTNHRPTTDRRRRRTTQARTTLGRTALIACIGVVTMLFSVAPAQAQDDSPFPPEVTPTGTLGNWTLYDDIVPRVYGFEGDGYAVITDGSLVDVCTGGTPDTHPRMIKQTQSGTWQIRMQPGVQTSNVTVYDTDLDVFAFFDASCPLFGTDAFPEPFATGEVTFRDRAWNLSTPFFGFDQTLGRYSNGVRGDVIDAEGNRHRLRAWVTYDLTETGPIFLAEHLSVRPLR